MEPEELVIYDWINPVQPPEMVKGERHRMVALLSIRHGVHHYLDDIWQEWQMAVHHRIRVESGPPVGEREVFTFGIARNLCRAYSRKDRRMIPILESSTASESTASGVRENSLDSRRIDEPAGPVNKPVDPPLTSDDWGDSGGVTECVRRLRPQAMQILHETYVEGRRSQEVGERLGLSADNVRQQLRRARDELRRCMSLRFGRSERNERRSASK